MTFSEAWALGLWAAAAVWGSQWVVWVAGTVCTCVLSYQMGRTVVLTSAPVPARAPGESGENVPRRRGGKIGLSLVLSECQGKGKGWKQGLRKADMVHSVVF